MIVFEEVITRIECLKAEDLEYWIRERWVLPIREQDVFHFSEADFARIQFLCDMHYDLEVETETLPIILSLMDQVYDLRRQIKHFTQAIHDQPADVRQNILETMQLLQKPQSDTPEPDDM